MRAGLLTRRARQAAAARAIDSRAASVAAHGTVEDGAQVGRGAAGRRCAATSAGRAGGDDPAAVVAAARARGRSRGRRRPPRPCRARPRPPCCRRRPARAAAASAGRRRPGAGRWSARPAGTGCGRAGARCSSVASLIRCASPPDSSVAGWPRVEVAQPDLAQRAQAAGDRRDVGEELRRVVDGQRQHVGDRPAAVADLERLGVVPGAVADRARRVGAGQEQQLDGDEALALAVRAAAALDVEGEPADRVAAPPGLVGGGEQLADPVEQAGVGGQVRPRRAADRLLVDLRPAGRSPSSPSTRGPAGVRSSSSSASSSSSVPSAASPPRWSRTASASTPVTSVDLPEPDTPVTAVNTPSGTSTSRPAGCAG